MRPCVPPASIGVVPPAMSDHELLGRSALELAALIRSKQLSPVELTELALARIEAVNPRLNAFCLVAADVARRQAREAEIAVTKGEPISRLHGVPVSMKDVLFTRGLRTTGGSRLFAEAVPEEDALAVARLRAAGTVLLGKTATSELGHKAVTESPLFGISRNPWDPALTPGGSSGGAAAAVAAGLGPLALGTDGGGSVRIPAAFCGVYGFKPSAGRVPHHGGFPGWEPLSVAGPITRTVRDAAAVLDVIAGGDDRDRRSLPAEPGSYVDACDGGIRGLHVAWTPDLGYAAVDPQVRAVCENAAAEFDTLGCHVEVVNPAWDDPEDAFRTIVAAQFYAHWSNELPAREAEMDPTLVKFIRVGGAIAARDYVLALARVEIYWAAVLGFLERFDLLLTPTAAVPPFAADGPPPREVDGRRVSPLGWMPFTFPFNLTGQPAASVPAGLTDDGRPVGLQIIGRRHADRVVLAASAAFEAAYPWTQRLPRA
jgi:aspartyl-tRNA(Asn)/glutamyl-tRNA(Gln) amidotransferase subunit A